MYLSLEDISFVSRDRNPPGRVWLEIVDQKLRDCLMMKGATHIDPSGYDVALMGTAAGDPRNSYGHMGVYSNEIRVTAIRRGGPCKS
jgi:hypothetical protein